jgi:hypothetical protein
MTRFLPEMPFPAYAYTPGQGQPHPTRDPRGHSHGATHPAPPPPDPERWRDSRDYLRGVDLYNAGYYWEAHEVWEGLWNACGRTGETAVLLQALIALAASALKRRAGNTAGAEAHARRAVMLLRGLRGPGLGLDPAALARQAETAGGIARLAPR